MTAANQKEALKSGFCVKEEPEAEEALSPARCPSFSLGHDAPAVPGRPRQEGSILSHDISVKVASELLMKLSGKTSRISVVGKPNPNLTLVSSQLVVTEIALVLSQHQNLSVSYTTLKTAH